MYQMYYVFTQNAPSSRREIIGYALATVPVWMDLRISLFVYA